MVKGMDCLILRTGKIHEAVSFYKAIGLPLRPGKETDGSAYFTCDLHSQRFAIHEAPDGFAPQLNLGGSTLIGLEVSSLDQAYDSALHAGAKVAVEPEPVPYGRRVVLLDPDGRAVELTER